MASSRRWPRPPRRPERLGWDVEEDGLIGAPRDPRRRRRGAHHDRRLAPDARARPGPASTRSRPTTRDGCGRSPCARRSPLRRPDHRLRAGRQREHRRLRPVAGDRAASRARNAWLHVDGAFGLWARLAVAARTSSTAWRADSWATDAHKWLNVPLRLRHRHRPRLRRAPRRDDARRGLLHRDGGDERDNYDWVAESPAAPAASRSTRPCELGRRGIADLIDRCCDRARQFADRLRDNRA